MNEGEIIAMSITGCCCLSMIFAVFMIILGSVMKWRFGVNLMGAECGKCGTPAPIVRGPKDGYEVLWGGWTCEKCKRKCDKWGRKR